MGPMMAAAAAAALVFVGWALFVQFAPSMGGVWLRMDDMNQWRFAPQNLVALAAKPLAVHTPTGRGFWTAPGMWPINLPLLLLAGLGAAAVLHRIPKASRDSDFAIA